MPMNRPVPINLAREADFTLGRTRIRPALRQFATDSAQKLIEPRVMQVLVALARRADTVVGRDELRSVGIHRELMTAAAR